MKNFGYISLAFLKETWYDMTNIEIEGKEYVLQSSKRGFRCISWHHHYIMTDWVSLKSWAIADGDKEIEKYYGKDIENENILL
jgi:hypothetical protein